jgi:hypothetical protein
MSLPASDFSQLSQLRLAFSAKLLLALASTVIRGPKFHGAHGRILLSDGSGSLQLLSLSQLYVLATYLFVHNLLRVSFIFIIIIYFECKWVFVWWQW